MSELNATKPNNGLKKKAKSIATFMAERPKFIEFLSDFAERHTSEIKEDIHEVFWKAAIQDETTQQQLLNYDVTKELLFEMVNFLREFSDRFAEGEEACHG